MTFFVAEIGSNWNGDLQKAKQIVSECKTAGADAVKFQMWRADDLYEGKYKEYELTFEKAEKIKKYCDHIGIEFFCSVFYPEAVAFLETLGVKRYKIGSRTFKMEDPFSKETIDAIIENTPKPVIYSNGFNQRVGFEGGRELYCIPEYPADPSDIDWELLKTRKGFSDHTLGIEQSLKYCKMKPDGILEKHVKTVGSHGPDVEFSITTQELADLITQST